MTADSSVNRRAHSLWTRVLAGAGATAMAGMLGAGLSGCIIVDDDDDYHDDDEIIVDDDVASVGIDEGATLDAEPGVGAGVFVEYRGLGEWNIWATCDTEITGYACIYDVFVSGEGLGFVEDDDLEGGDFIEEDFETVHLGMDTDYDWDGVFFETFTDEPILVEVWVDGRQDGSLTFWVENGEIWQGQPTNPVYFVP